MAKSRPEKQKVERNNAIYEERQKGLGYSAIAKQWNITPGRARQIYEKLRFLNWREEERLRA
jgi:hypothetical protein